MHGVKIRAFWKAKGDASGLCFRSNFARCVEIGKKNLFALTNEFNQFFKFTNKYPPKPTENKC
jgi:hypothetical protein